MSGGALWGGRFEGSLADTAVELSFSLHYDQALVFHDIRLNQVHAQALERAGVLSAEESKEAQAGLESIKTAIQSGELSIDSDDEDIHSFVERELVQRCGTLGKKIHTGKSRNDQVATDMRLFMKEAMQGLLDDLNDLMKAIWTLASQHSDQIFPGFTHFQVAQPVVFGHHLLAYYEKLKRDKGRLEDAMARMDECPLGSAALAGTNYPIDREAVAKELGFARPTQNSIDGVSDRDFLLEYSAASAILLLHLSQFAEELVLWSSPVIDFIQIGDDYTTGSSIMPQKKNPDMAEIIRGKSAMGISHLVSLFTLLKGLPMSYNRDLQDDKRLVFESFETLKLVLPCFTGMLGSITLNPTKIEEALSTGFILATEVADYLVKKSVPFRDAHEISGKIVRKAIEEGHTCLSALSLETFQSFSDAFEPDIVDVLTLKHAVISKSTTGGTAPAAVKDQLKKIQEEQSW